MNKQKIISLSAISILVVLALVVAVFATAEAQDDNKAVIETHVATLSVDPYVVTGGAPVDFTVTVTNEPGSADSIHEFRIYEHNEFTNLQCDVKPGWWGPFTGTTIFGNYCQWNAEPGSEILPGTSEFFTFTADTPPGECCRPWRMETRDVNEFWQFVNLDICIDTS